MKSNLKPRIKRTQKILVKNKKLVFSLLLIGVAVGLYVAVINNDKTDNPAGDTDAVTYSTNTPDENKPGTNYKWRGTDSDPKKIYVEGVGIDAFVQKVGVDQDNLIAVPNNVHIAGWFIDSAKPGDKGLSIINGHIDGMTTSGVFKGLEKITKGTKIKIQKGDDSIIEYETIGVVTVSKDEAASIIYSQDPNVASQLNLVTCTGAYIQEEKTYDKRIIVQARKI